MARWLFSCLLIALLAACGTADQFFQTDSGTEQDSATDDAASDSGVVEGDRPGDDTGASDGADLANDDTGPSDVADGADLAEDLSEAHDVIGDAADVPDVPQGLQGAGTWDDPYVISRFPFTDSRSTADSVTSVVGGYACSPSTNEGGAEVVYRIDAEVSGILVASVDDTSGDSVDPDVHILSSDDPADCIDRDNISASALLEDTAGHYVVVDTWVNGSGTPLSGPYALTVDLTELPAGDCRMTFEAINMINRDDPLQLPALGSVVMEAHLVTTEEFEGTWPTSAWDGIEAHYAASELVSGYSFDRHEPWAPEGEGGSMWGQGSTRRPPPLDEAWYVNMYWRNRPDPGTRMLIFNPVNGRAVVASAGYETGPGSADHIGGVVEEVHHHLGSRHRSQLIMGFLVDQELDLGPIDCP